jgi:hypothetical protein
VLDDHPGLRESHLDDARLRSSPRRLVAQSPSRTTPKIGSPTFSLRLGGARVVGRRWPGLDGPPYGIGVGGPALGQPRADVLRYLGPDFGAFWAFLRARSWQEWYLWGDLSGRWRPARLGPGPSPGRLRTG